MTPVGVAMVTALVAGVLALLLSLRAAPLGRRLGLLDWPDTDGGRKQHAVVTPLIGGVALVVATCVTCALTVWLLPAGSWVVQHITWLGGVVGVMFLIGFADDRFALGPVVRLALAIGMLLLALVYAPDFSLGFLRFADQPQVWPMGGWGDAFALLCLVGLLNAVNMADGKNGVILSLGLIWTAVLAARLPEPFLPVLAGVGAALGVLLVFNLRGRLFMGDGGSYALSALFGMLAIYAYNQDFVTMRAEDVAVLFAVPVFDTIRLLAVRSMAGKSPFEGDRNHLHHHLYNRYGWPRGLVVYIALVAVPNVAAILLPGTGLIWLAATWLAYVVALNVARLPTRAS